MNVKFKLVCFVAVMVFGVAVSNVSGMNKPHGEYIVCKTANVIDAKVYDNNCALLDGECVIEYPDKTVYKGRLKSGVFEGKGKLMWPDGCIYEGDFANGKYEGEGKYRSADGKVVHDGIWKNDRAVRNSDAVDPMNHIVVGFGGVTIDREGRLFFVKGDFLNGAYRVKYPDWSVYEGQFANGKKHGEGVLVLFNGEVYDGKWRDGKYIEGIHSSKTVYKGRKAFGCY
ncbi:MAG: hypothetical protein LBG13_02040, partial [Holosporales bacterium]|nr:hypothetical protein [Holosporales bacterium]